MSAVRIIANPPRQDARYLAELPVTLLNSSPHPSLATWDVSARGLFLQTPVPLPLRRFLRFSVVLPRSGLCVLLHGMVVNVAGPIDPEGRPRGVGVELYAIGYEARSAWWDVVRRVRDAVDGADPASGVRVRARPLFCVGAVKC